MWMKWAKAQLDPENAGLALNRSFLPQ